MAQSTPSATMRTWIVFLLSVLCASGVFGSYSYYQGPINVPHVLHGGYLADTHEVAAAKSAHLAALATQSHGHGYNHDEGYSGSYGGDYGHGDFRYHGPIAIPHVLHDGHIADTHEVAAAKSAHLAALATQSHGHGYNHDEGYSGSYGGDYGHGDFRYHGPIAIPHVLHDGHIADTHEVAAAKAEHFAAVAKAKAHAGYGQDHSGRYAGSYGEYSGALSGAHHIAPYHGPLAKPVVLKSGYLADTHEVAAAKGEHFAAVAKAKAHAGYGQDHSGRYAGSYGEYSGALSGAHHIAPYHGPLAKPVVLKSGYLADTHEVAAAKGEHFAAVAKAKSHAGYGQDHSGRYAGGYGEYSGAYSGAHHIAPYHGPPAKPVVLKSGYLADTHEVAAAKYHHLEALHKANYHDHHHHY